MVKRTEEMQIAENVLVSMHAESLKKMSPTTMEIDVQQDETDSSEELDDDPVRLRAKVAKLKAVCKILAADNQTLREKSSRKKAKKRAPHESSAGLILDTAERVEQKKAEADTVVAAAAAKVDRAAERVRKRGNREALAKEKEAKKAEEDKAKLAARRVRGRRGDAQQRQEQAARPQGPRAQSLHQVARRHPQNAVFAPPRQGGAATGRYEGG